MSDPDVDKARAAGTNEHSHYRTDKHSDPDKDANGATPPPPRPPAAAQPPDDTANVEVTAPSRSAGGFPAIREAMKHVWGEAGVIRGTRALLKLNQHDGFDCQGCAWPDPDDRSFAEFCENGAKAVAEETTTERVTEELFANWSVLDLAKKSDYWLGKRGRLTRPMILRAGSAHYEPITWEESFHFIGGKLNALASPDEAVFYTSGRTSNEAAFLYQLFVRQFGTNNLPDCSNMCHESSGSALTPTIGIGKGTVTLEDFDHSEAIFVIGQNPGTNHPRMLSALQSAKRNGATIVSINPLPEAGLQRFKHPQEIGGILGPGTKLADLFLQVRINGDVPLLKGIMKEMLEEEERRPGTILDLAFIESSTDGFEPFASALREASWDVIIERSGVTRVEIAAAANVMMRSKRTICCWAMGLTQHRNAVANIQEIVNMLLMRGSIGREGAGVCPVRGHSNVQGDRTMGIWERPTAAFLDSMEKALGFSPPRHHGYDTVEAIKAMHAGKAKIFFAMGGNFLSATPDTDFTAEALRRCELTVHVSTKLNRAHLITGREALILPCLGRTEVDEQESGAQFVSVENSMGIVHSSRGSLPPASEHLRSEPAIVAGLATATLGSRSSLDWSELVGDYDRIRDLIERVIPGFEDYNARVRQPGGFYLPNAAREGSFKTDTGKANFTVHEIPPEALGPGQLMMMTIRSHDQYNTTIYGLEDRYRGIHNGRRVVLMNESDIQERGLRAGQIVDITSHFEGEQRTAKKFVVVPYSIPPRCAATYFPEANVLVPIRSVAEKSNTPASKSVVITVAASEDSARHDEENAG